MWVCITQKSTLNVFFFSIALHVFERVSLNLPGHWSSGVLFLYVPGPVSPCLSQPSTTTTRARVHIYTATSVPAVTLDLNTGLRVLHSRHFIVCLPSPHNPKEKFLFFCGDVAQLIEWKIGKHTYLVCWLVLCRLERGGTSFEEIIRLDCLQACRTFS